MEIRMQEGLYRGLLGSMLVKKKIRKQNGVEEKVKLQGSFSRSLSQPYGKF